MTRFFSVLQLFVASQCRLQTKVTCPQTRAQSLLNMVLRVISLVQRATGSMVSQWRLVSVTDSGQRTEMSLVKVSSCSYLLFLIFIDNLPNCVKQSKVVLYADDTALFFANKDVMTIERALQEEELNSLNNWFHENGLILNCSKTNVMVFGTSQRLVKTSGPVLKLSDSFLPVKEFF